MALFEEHLRARDALYPDGHSFPEEVRAWRELMNSLTGSDEDMDDLEGLDDLDDLDDFDDDDTDGDDFDDEQENL